MSWVILVAKAFGIGLVTVFLTELAKKNAYASAAIIAFPVMTAFAMALLYIDTGEAAQSYKLGFTTFWLIIASLSFFLFLFITRQIGMGFWVSFSSSIVVTMLSIVGITVLLKQFGIDLLSKV